MFSTLSGLNLQILVTLIFMPLHPKIWLYYFTGVHLSVYLSKIYVKLNISLLFQNYPKTVLFRGMVFHKRILFYPQNYFNLDSSKVLRLGEEFSSAGKKGNCFSIIIWQLINLSDINNAWNLSQILKIRRY